MPQNVTLDLLSGATLGCRHSDNDRVIPRQSYIDQDDLKKRNQWMIGDDHVGPYSIWRADRHPRPRTMSRNDRTMPFWPIDGPPFFGTIVANGALRTWPGFAACPIIGASRTPRARPQCGFQPTIGAGAPIIFSNDIRRVHKDIPSGRYARRRPAAEDGILLPRITLIRSKTSPAPAVA